MSTNTDAPFLIEDESTTEEVQRRAESLGSDALLTRVLDTMPQQVAVLDRNRHIVAFNLALRREHDDRQLQHILGNRPGQLLGCRHLGPDAGPCGTNEACRECGARKAIAESMRHGTTATRDCHMTRAGDDEPLDLKVTASAMHLQGEDFTVLSIVDMADEKRREILERTFFHDVLNAAGGALGLAEAIAESREMDEVRELAPLLVMVSRQLIEEIEYQRDLVAAERGILTVQKEELSTLSFLKNVLGTYRDHPASDDRLLKLDPAAPDLRLRTGRALLHRVLGNMTKNALEATGPGKTVTLGCHRDGGEICLWVHNEEPMPRAVQIQIFKRSFSTKGPGRGIGTYSIRLLGEKYLGGRVSFDSEEGRGTTFMINLPDGTG